MKVKCIINKLIFLPKDTFRDYTSDGENFSIIEGKEYLVYSIWSHLSYIWYSLCDESHTYYPIWYPALLFKIIDNRLSRYWIFSDSRSDDKKIPFIGFPEWANDPYYYDRLTDGEEKDVEIFKRYKAKMDLEFPNPSIEDKAVDLGDHWLFCPFCVDAWQSFSQDGMVICPKCNRMLHNPYYKDLI